MSIETIGTNIARLRKEKGATQEELAKSVCVSPQAVSKWENGGVPDTELLPKIADFFEISLDTLFGRSLTEYTDIEKAIEKKLAHTPQGEKFNQAFALCWSIQQALSGESNADFNWNDLPAFQKRLGDKRTHSQMKYDSGYTLMQLSKVLPYFMLAPEPADTESAYFDGIDYLAFFKDISDKAVFDTLIFLNKRESSKSFTANLLIKNLKIDEENAKKVIEVLKKYKSVTVTQIEMDDILQETYLFEPNPAFVAMLTFARELISPPRAHAWHIDWRERPYLG